LAQAILAEGQAEEYIASTWHSLHIL